MHSAIVRPLALLLLACLPATLSLAQSKEQNKTQNTKSKAKQTATKKKQDRFGKLPAGVKVERDIVYQRVGDKALLLDLYRPESSKAKLPVIVWVHGGGWKNGSKNRCPAVWLASHGYAIASINYRLTHEAQWPAQIDDCRAAVRWLRRHANDRQLDEASIAAWGSSAGGHLVALMGTLAPAADKKVSSRVQAVCDWFGPTDLLTMPPNNVGNGRTEQDVANSNGAKLLGATVREIPELAKRASAFYQVSKGDPPFLIMHGDKDPGVPISQSERLHKRLLSHGVDSTLHVVKGAGHGGKQFQTPEVRDAIRRFFDKNLK